LRLKFVLKRGFIEFIKLYEIDWQLVHRIKFELRDKCVMAMEVSKHFYFKEFFEDMP